MSKRTKLSGVVLCLAFVSCATGLARSAAAGSSPKAYCLLAFDTNDRSVGPYCKLGMQTVLNTLFQSKQLAGQNQRMQWRVLAGQDFSMRNVLDHLQRTRVGPQDTVFLYYLAHGGLSKSTGHFLAFPDGNLDRTKIRTLMVKSGARQSILVTDCCSNLVSNVQVHAARSGGPNQQLIAQLFFGQQGLTDIISSQRGYYAVTDKVNGGIFTGAFCSNLYQNVAYHDKNRDGLVSWKEFSSHVSRDANQRFQQMMQGLSSSNPLARALNDVGQKSHHARRIYSNALLPLQYTRRLKVANLTGTTLHIKLQYYAFVEGKWSWRDATPGDQVYRIAPGQVTMLKDGQQQLAGHQMRIWATSADGKRRWKKGQTNPIRLAPAEGYVARQPAVFTYRFK